MHVTAGGQRHVKEQQDRRQEVQEHRQHRISSFEALATQPRIFPSQGFLFLALCISCPIWTADSPSERAYLRRLRRWHSLEPEGRIVSRIFETRIEKKSLNTTLGHLALKRLGNSLSFGLHSRYLRLYLSHPCLHGEMGEVKESRLEYMRTLTPE